jgi:hypothetical protein
VRNTAFFVRDTTGATLTRPILVSARSAKPMAKREAAHVRLSAP